MFSASADSMNNSTEKAVVSIGKPAPAFVVTALDGHEVSLAEFRGKVVLINFWATWCAPCRIEMPWLAALREQYAPRGFEVLGIVTDRASDQKVMQIAEEYGVKYPLLRCNHTTAQAYGGLPYLPASFYIDRTGNLVIRSAEASSKAEIEMNIRKALGIRSR